MHYKIQTWLHNYTGSRHKASHQKKRQNGRDYENIQLGFDSQSEAAVSATLSELYFVPFLMA